MAVTIPDTQYIGINLHRTSDEDVPLGFLTPGGTNAAAKKRIGTVDQWCGHNSSRSGYIKIDECEQFEKDHPAATVMRDNSDSEYNPGKQYRVPNEEGVDYKILDNVPNEPQAGFRITRMVSRSGSWNGGNKLVRIEDPRGFELEISVDNLVKVMSMTTFVDGVCQTECVWGRDGANNILLPVNSDPYTEARSTTDYRKKKAISLRDIKFGDTVELKKSEYFGGLTGEYLGAYNVYLLLRLNNDKDSNKSNYLYQHEKHGNTMIKKLRRYVIRTKDEKSGKYLYFGVAQAKVHKVINSADTAIDRPKTIDAEDFQEASYSNIDGFPAVITTEKLSEIDVSQSLTMIPVDVDTVLKAAKAISSGSLNLFAQLLGDSSQTHYMRYYREYVVDIHRGTKAERDQIFMGQVTKFRSDLNTWAITGERGKGGNGVFAALKDSDGANPGLLITDYQWHRLGFEVAGKLHMVPIKKDHMYL